MATCNRSWLLGLLGRGLALDSFRILALVCRLGFDLGVARPPRMSADVAQRATGQDVDVGFLMQAVAAPGCG